MSGIREASRPALPSEHRRTLNVLVLQGRSLPKSGCRKTGKYYVEIKVDMNVQKSTISPRGDVARWNQPFIFDCMRTSILDVKVFRHHKFSKDRYLSGFSRTVQSMLGEEDIVQPLLSFTLTGEIKSCGFLGLTVTIHDGQSASRDPVTAGQRDRAQTVAPETRPDFISFAVPWLCATSPYDYDPRGFWDFPERAGWMLDGQGKHGTFPNGITFNLSYLDAKYICRQRTVPTEMIARRPRDSLRLKSYRLDGRDASLSEEVAFLQAWLFFGVLTEISSICGLPIDMETEFTILHGDGNRILSTQALNGLSRRWLLAMKSHGAASGRDQVAQMLDVLKHVMSLQTIISTFGDSRKQETRNLTYAECKVLLSIRILLRVVMLTLVMSETCDLREIQFLLNPQLQQSFPTHWDELKTFSDRELLANDWCPSECKLLERMDGAYNFFATHLKRYRLDHSRCNDFLCLADQVDEVDYKTAHVEPHCQCNAVIVDPDNLRDILEKGKVPRISISDENQLVVSEDLPYVAISHVWSHGLGNPHENSLPLCQIRRLKNHIADLSATTGDAPLAVWIDTLCIPVATSYGEYRKKAIILMSQTYEHAIAVLGLDRELVHLDTRQASMLEENLMLLHIGWTRRLWTLQEAALARKLYVQTFHGPRKVENSETLLTEKERVISQICFHDEIEELIRDRIPPASILRKSTFETTSLVASALPFYATTTALQRLCMAVKHRCTSRMEDEAIILAITLGLSAKELVNIPDVDSRMARFLMMISEVPSEIIFGRWQRITCAPFRWAPRSLLEFPIYTLTSFGPPGICDAHGLHASYKGVILRDASRQRPGEDGYYAVDCSAAECPGIKYRFMLIGNRELFELPERPAFIFSHLGVDGDIAIVNILRQNEAREAGEEVHGSERYRGSVLNTDPNKQNNTYDAVIVGYATLVASGETLDEEPQRMLKGVETGSEQRWCIT